MGLLVSSFNHQLNVVIIKEMKITKIDSDKELAKVIVGITDVLELDAIICFTEKGELAWALKELDPDVKVIAATSVSDTFDELTETSIKTIRMPIHGLDKYRQIPHLLSVALKTDSISPGAFVLAAIGRRVYPDKGNLISLGEAERELEELSIKDLLKLTDGIRPAVLDKVMELARRIGLITRREKRIGTIFTLGDSKKVLELSKQLIPNPFQGHEESERRITNSDTHDSVIELAKLDGAFVIRGDGLIQTAGTFLGSESDEEGEIRPERNDLELPEGLGTRHVASAAITSCTDSTAVVVSETDGNIRVFSDGKMVLKMDPSLDYEPIR